ncbi:hypothetical protein GCM10011381_01140 [Klenkia taihuensis]|nr:hypothetical protein GCM10011381_01140 [Klenkia taihuensis]
MPLPETSAAELLLDPEPDEQAAKLPARTTPAASAASAFHRDVVVEDTVDLPVQVKRGAGGLRAALPAGVSCIMKSARQGDPVPIWNKVCAHLPSRATVGPPGRAGTQRQEKP